MFAPAVWSLVTVSLVAGATLHRSSTKTESSVEQNGDEMLSDQSSPAAERSPGLVVTGYPDSELQSVNHSIFRTWQINQDICPPALCEALKVTPTPAAVTVPGAVDESIIQPVTVSKLSAERQRPGVYPGTEPSATPTVKAQSFPFLEADIVLDPDLHFVHNNVYQRQTVLRVKPTPKPRKQTGSPNQTSSAGRSRQKRSTVRMSSRLWPNATVPYYIDPALPSETQDAIRTAMAHISNYTCITFRRAKSAIDKDFVYFIFQPGCWSFIGRVGGRQLISYGEGCEAFGVVLHEITHALGFWHEQTRPDRDRYIRIFEENITPGALEQFEKREWNESSSLGYAYDYHSITHYANNTYSIAAGKPTIRPINIGRTLGLSIGQRRRLSSIDIAQLNAMYSCHQNEAQRKACKDGWIKHRASCYQFLSAAEERKTFYRAAETCRKSHGQLVAINYKNEDDFLKSYLTKNFPSSAGSGYDVWMTAGLNNSTRETNNSQFLWYMRGSGNDVTMEYEGWPSSFANRKSPGSEFIVLRRVNETEVGDDASANENEFEWGVASLETRLPVDNRTVYPFICETKANISCFHSRGSLKRGEDYRGKLSYTTDSITCQRWTRRYPHDHDLMTGDPEEDAKQGIGDHNQCRNPRGMRNRPWCFTLRQDVKWQYCDVPICR